MLPVFVEAFGLFDGDFDSWPPNLNSPQGRLLSTPSRVSSVESSADSTLVAAQ